MGDAASDSQEAEALGFRALIGEEAESRQSLPFVGKVKEWEREGVKDIDKILGRKEGKNTLERVRNKGN